MSRDVGQTCGYVDRAIGRCLGLWRSVALGLVAGNVGIISGLQPTVTAQAGSVPTVVNIAASSAAVRSDGTVWFWGNDLVGTTTGVNQPPNVTNGSIPTHIPGTYNAKQIVVDSPADKGDILNNDGTVWGWDGKLTDSPTQVPGLTNVTQLTSGGGSTLALRADGTVWAWGSNIDCMVTPQLANSSSGCSTVSGPTQATGMPAISQLVASDNDFVIARTTAGVVWGWGHQSYQILSCCYGATQIFSYTDVTSVAAGYAFALALHSNGTVTAWGDNTYGQHGNGVADGSAFQWSPTQVPVSGVTSISAAGGDNSAFAVSGGQVWAWGQNGSGELGIGTTSADQPSPQLISLANVASVVAGSADTFAINSSGAAWAWGYNGDGELGDGTMTDHYSPRRVLGLDSTVSQTCTVPAACTARFELNNIPLTISVPFLPATFTTSAPDNAIQLATATTTTPYNEITVIVARYGSVPPTEVGTLPPAQSGIAGTYLNDLSAFRQQQGGVALPPPAANLFGQQVQGISNAVPIYILTQAPTVINITEWVAESDNYVWIFRVAQQVEGNPLLASVQALSSITASIDALAAQAAPHAATMKAGSAPGPNIPSPFWWHGNMCDSASYDTGGRPGAYDMFHWGNLTACGPRPENVSTSDNYVYETDSNGNVVGAQTQEWECAELSARWIWLAYGVPSQAGANGNKMLQRYDGKGNLHAVYNNGTAGIVPAPGDILSIGPSSAYGHTNVVISSDINSAGNGSVTVVEQNAAQGGTEPLTVSNWKITTTSDGGSVIGWLHNGTAPAAGSTSSYSYNPPPNNPCPSGSSSSYYPGDGTPGGYWLGGSDGGVFTLGNLSFYGSTGGKQLNAPVVGIARTPTAQGYWLVANDGGIFTFGNAGFYGSMGNQTLNACAVGMTASGDGGGYWIVAADGGIFNFGDAHFYGSEGGQHLNAPVVGMSRTPDSGGYWLVGQDGGVFTFGDAPFYGSGAGLHSPAPFVSMSATPDGRGYWLVNSNGQVYSFGDAQYYGGAGEDCNCVVGVATTGDGAGYYEIENDGTIWCFGDAGDYGSAASNKPFIGIAPSP